MGHFNFDCARNHIIEKPDHGDKCIIARIMSSPLVNETPRLRVTPMASWFLTAVFLVLSSSVFGSDFNQVSGHFS